MVVCCHLSFVELYDMLGKKFDSNQYPFKRRINKLSYIFMQDRKLFEKPLVAFDNSELSNRALELIDTIKHLCEKVTLLSVNNSNKLYVQTSLSGQAIHKSLL